MSFDDVYGLTGGIACGKSTVAGFLSQLGGRVIDADQISRDVVLIGSEGHEALTKTFGKGILCSDGTIDRGALGQVVFADKAARATLEGILHPLIVQESLRRIEKARRSNPPAIFYEAALLIETGRAADFRPLIVVWSHPELQLSRIQARDRLDISAAQQRLESQMPIMDKTQMADHLIENNGDLKSLAERTQSLWKALVKP